MCKMEPKTKHARLLTSACLSTLVGLAASLLPTQNAQAQTCGNLLSMGPVISPISGSRVVVGQTITIARFSASSAAGNCIFRNGVAFYAQPNGTVTQVMQDLSLNPGETESCLPAGGATVT